MGKLRHYEISTPATYKERELVKQMAAEKGMKTAQFLRYVLGLYERARKRINQKGE